MFQSLRNKASSLSGGALRPASSEKPSCSTHSAVLSQVHAFEIALQAMDLLLDDRNLEGTELLKAEHKKHKQGNEDPAAIFPLALGVMEFIEATLGFETDVMNRARKTLTEAENASLEHSKYNQKHGIATSHIYPPGTEFNVTYAESTLLNALVMLLQENNTMMEQAKALLKLRKAYQILDQTYKKIKESEPLFNKNLAKFRRQAENRTTSYSSVDLPGFECHVSDSNSSQTSTLSADKELMHGLEKVYQMRKSRIEGTSISQSVNVSHVNLFKDSASSICSFGQQNGAFARSSRDRDSIYTGKSHDPTTRTPACARAPSFDIQPAPVEIKGKEEAGKLDDSDENDFMDASEVADPSRIGSELNSTLGTDLGSDLCNDLSNDLYTDPGTDASLKLGVLSESVISLNTSFTSLSTGTGIGAGTSEDAHLHVSTVDEFIHSGVQLCFGILQVVLSLIPPAIGKVLSIVGFKGDRQTGLNMLWRTAITARNIHGDLALLFLLVFYDGPIQFVDTGYQLPGYEDSERNDIIQLENRSTVSDAELSRIIDYPNLYTPQLLKKARSLFPNNCLWLLQEGRMLVASGEVHKALAMMQDFTDDPGCHVEMEQVEAIFTFDRAIFYTFVHDFDSAARDFIRMLDISTWSSAVYLFLAGACYLEKWRMIQMGMIACEGDVQEKLEFYAEKADHYLKLAPSYIPGYGANASKKGGIGGSGKQMPFDKFVLRKTKQIEARKKANPKLTYIECVGTSLILELIYFWNGYARMPRFNLEQSILMLNFSTGPYAKFPETTDEAMIRNLYQSIALRQTGEVKEGLELLDTEVISKYVSQDSISGPFKFQKMTYSPYLYPTALHEKASFLWKSHINENSRTAISEGISWLKKAETVSDIGDYEMSNRTSMAIKAGAERLEQLREILGREKKE